MDPRQTLRRAADRGATDLGWLQSRHTFSFGQYLDPGHMGFGVLRVINDDRVQPGQGFGTHPHRDMEILTYVLEGALEHRDSLGNGSVIRRGDVQRMTAGIGVAHSEYNHSDIEPVHFLQIWVLPESNGLEPGYEQKHFSSADTKNALRLVAARGGREDAVTVHQDLDLYLGMLESHAEVVQTLAPHRQAWLHLARGAVRVNDQPLLAGDGLALSGGQTLRLACSEPAVVMLFDMAATSAA